MAQYDPNIIYTFAKRLYQSAQQIVVTYTIVGVLIGLIGGYSIERGFGVIALIGMLIAGGLGYVIGKQRAFQLKLQAQIALCQAKIEENTRIVKAS